MTTRDITPPIQRPPVRRAIAAALVLLAWVVGSAWQGDAQASGTVWSVVRFALAVALLLVGIQLAWRPFVPSLPQLRRLSIVLLLVPLGVMAFLLPPFEAPDEEVHWMLALKYFRRDVAGEPSAYQLSEAVFNSPRLHFHPDEKFDASRLDVDKTEIDRIPRAELDAKHAWWRKNYAYAMPYAYPVEALVFSIFPRVDQVRQAEMLFYFCRLVGAALIVGMLWALNRRFEVPFTAIFFFSLPLVLQQSAAVSSDIMLTGGTLAVLMLFLTSPERPERLRLAAMWVLSLIVVALKIMLAGVALLPLALTLRPWVRRPGRWALGGLVAAVVAAYPLWLAVLYQVRAYGATQNLQPIVEQQVANLSTAAGWQSFWAVYSATMAYAGKVASWAQPLGWVDTILDPVHITLLEWALAVALLLDLIVYAPRLVAAVRERASAAGWMIAAVIVSVLFVTFADVLIYFLISTPGDLGVRVQVRHFVPIAAMALMLPVAVLRPSTVPQRSFVLPTFAAAFTCTLLAARTIMLAIDLLGRYW